MSPLQQQIIDMVIEPMTVQDIAELLGRTPATIDVTVRRMVTDGLMYRKSDPQKPIRYLYWARPSNKTVEQELRQEIGELPVQELIAKLEEELKGSGLIETQQEEMPMTEMTPGALTMDGDIWEVRMSVPVEETLKALRAASDLLPKEQAVLLRRLAAIMELTHA